MLTRKEKDFFLLPPDLFRNAWGGGGVLLFWLKHLHRGDYNHVGVKGQPPQAALACQDKALLKLLGFGDSIT